MWQVGSATFRCANCGSDKFVTIDTKYFVTSLRRCQACHLMYRTPPDNDHANYNFYQRAYRQGFTTDLPNQKSLQHLLKTKFAETEKSYHNYILVLRQLGLAPGARIFDYGCSWGYGSWQLKESGYRVLAYEISKPRARFANEQLGIQCVADISEADFKGPLRNSFDCFFSAHVLEHVPSPSRVIEFARLALRPGGFFVAFTPNGSDAFRRTNARGWHLLWGRVHPNLMDDHFYRHQFPANCLYLDSSPADLNLLSRFGRGESTSDNVDLSGSELLCVAKV
jgi:2-polyprenyl-3-methyl-5-hydroxy-6-metoxy-1,4-benzoquinol methylase